MSGAAYYNEHDRKAAAWLRELIRCGHIAPGEVDERSIVDVRADDLRGFAQCHFFSGIGVWSHALRLAGWADGREVWTGSCPCQPWSDAGKKKGADDERHLWPELARLIRERRPRAFFGEQVASKDGLAWLDLVLADLEAAGYTAGAIDLCAAGVGAPHIRQRLWIVANADGGDASAERLQRSWEHGQQPQNCGAGFVGDTERAGLEGHAGHGDNWARWQDQARPVAPAGVVNGFWRGAELIWCSDQRWRPVEPGSEPLAHGAPARVGRLRGYGNAIVAALAAEVIAAVM